MSAASRAELDRYGSHEQALQARQSFDLLLRHLVPRQQQPNNNDRVVEDDNDDDEVDLFRIPMRRFRVEDGGQAEHPVLRNRINRFEEFMMDFEEAQIGLEEAREPLDRLNNRWNPNWDNPDAMQERERERERDRERQRALDMRRARHARIRMMRERDDFLLHRSVMLDGGKCVQICMEMDYAFCSEDAFTRLAEKLKAVAPTRIVIALSFRHAGDLEQLAALIQSLESVESVKFALQVQNKAFLLDLLKLIQGSVKEVTLKGLQLDWMVTNGLFDDEGPCCTVETLRLYDTDKDTLMAIVEKLPDSVTLLDFKKKEFPRLEADFQPLILLRNDIRALEHNVVGKKKFLTCIQGIDFTDETCSLLERSLAANYREWSTIPDDMQVRDRSAELRILFWFRLVKEGWLQPCVEQLFDEEKFVKILSDATDSIDCMLLLLTANPGVWLRQLSVEVLEAQEERSRPKREDPVITNVHEIAVEDEYSEESELDDGMEYKYDDDYDY